MSASVTQRATTVTPKIRHRPLTAVDVVQRFFAYTLLGLLVLFCLVPFAWVVFSAVDGNAGPTVQLPALSFENFIRFFTNAGTPMLLVNSLIIGVGGTALNLVLGIAG